MAATIDHPNVIPVYDAGLEESLYIVMRYVAGADLRALLKSRGPSSPEATVELLRRPPAASTPRTATGSSTATSSRRTSCSAVATGATEHVYLSDFGVSKHGSESGLTSKGTLVGTSPTCRPSRSRAWA